jgi:hypothetical protein
MFRRCIFQFVFMLVVFGCVLFPEDSRTQSSPEKSLASYIAALQTGNATALKQVTTAPQYDSLLKETNGALVYPILQQLGSIVNTKITSVTPFAEFSAYKAEVIHVAGSSLWQFRLDEAGNLIARALLLQSNISPKNAFNNPGQIWGGDNSVFNNAGKFLWRDKKAKTISPVIIGSVIRPAGIPDSTLAWDQDETSAKTGQSGPIVAQDPCKLTPLSCGWFVDPVVDQRVVEFIFATDRQPDPSSKKLSFIGDRQDKLAFGAASVRVPEDHKFGRLELPSAWHLFGYEIYREKQDDSLHFSIKQLSILSEADLAKLIAEQGAKTALIFVHGFNTSFEEAIYRNAQIVWDMQFKRTLGPVFVEYEGWR